MNPWYRFVSCRCRRDEASNPFSAEIQAERRVEPACAWRTFHLKRAVQDNTEEQSRDVRDRNFVVVGFLCFLPKNNGGKLVFVASSKNLVVPRVVVVSCFPRSIRIVL